MLRAPIQERHATEHAAQLLIKQNVSGQPDALEALAMTRGKEDD